MINRPKESENRFLMIFRVLEKLTVISAYFRKLQEMGTLPVGTSFLMSPSFLMNFAGFEETPP